MKIILAEESHLDRVMEIISLSRQYMRSQGNDIQWINGYPSRDIMLSSIHSGELFVCIQDECVEGVFYFSSKPDPFYHHILNGQWMNDEPYGVIHRLAGSGQIKGLGEKVINWCGQQIPNIRIDTHADNQSMLRILKRMGFQFCGIIHVSDGSPRQAFQKIFKF